MTKRLTTEDTYAQRRAKAANDAYTSADAIANAAWALYKKADEARIGALAERDITKAEAEKESPVDPRD